MPNPNNNCYIDRNKDNSPKVHITLFNDHRHFETTIYSYIRSTIILRKSISFNLSSAIALLLSHTHTYHSLSLPRTHTHTHTLSFLSQSLLISLLMILTISGSVRSIAFLTLLISPFLPTDTRYSKSLAYLFVIKKT